MCYECTIYWDEATGTGIGELGPKTGWMSVVWAPRYCVIVFGTSTTPA